MIKQLFIALLIFSGLSVSAQKLVPCATDEIYREQVIVNPGLLKIEEEANQAIRKHQETSFAKAGIIKYIPVVFHIIHDGGLENISQAQIMDQIRIINEDFRKKPGTNGGRSANVLASDMELEFRLAQYDPAGKKHDGINRFRSSLTNNGGDNIKNKTFPGGVSYWDSNRYLNIWVVKTIDTTKGSGEGLVLGYAQFPWQQGSKPTTDGIVIRSDQVGVIGTGQVSQLGRTLTHEIGHWAGLYHPFQGGCTGGDQVSDTPPVASASYGCNKSKNSCSNDSPNLNDMVENYMDYADGTCMELFTIGQKSRAHSSLSTYRNTLYTNNVQYAGIDPSSGQYLPVTPSANNTAVFYSFEAHDPSEDGIVFNNFNNPSNGWQVSSGVGYNSNSCLYMRNFTNTLATINSRDGFQTAEYDISQMHSPALEFVYAYAQKSSANSDSFIVTISNNFGMNEQRIFGKMGEELATSELQTTEFIPTSETQWKHVSINLNAFKTYTHARFRFEFLNRRGNNIYLDNLALLTRYPTGIENMLKEEYQFNVYPNPMGNNGTVAFQLEKAGPVNISLTDMLGRKVQNIENNMLTSGSHEVSFSKGGLPAGIYYLHFEAGEKRFTHKLLIN